ncbi:MAG: hypothetical protein ACRDRH_04740 [Pseudonocardia sp.]
MSDLPIRSTAIPVPDEDRRVAVIVAVRGGTKSTGRLPRDRLTANLGRGKLETWPTEGTEAGQLDLWVADKGTLGRGAGPWPLLHDGEVDIFDGVPFGRSHRGQHSMRRCWSATT